MADQPQKPEQAASAVRNNLRELAQVLRQAGSLSPEAQRTLADLVSELSTALEAEKLNPTVNAHLADSTAHLIAGLRQRHKGLLTAARERLQDAAAAAEVQAPMATGIAERLIEALSNIGI